MSLLNTARNIRGMYIEKIGFKPFAWSFLG